MLSQERKIKVTAEFYVLENGETVRTAHTWDLYNVSNGIITVGQGFHIFSHQGSRGKYLVRDEKTDFIYMCYVS